MTNNPADVLHAFFIASWGTRINYSFLTLACCLGDVRTQLEAWRRMGREGDAEIFDKALERWTQALYASFGDGGLTLSGELRPADGDMGLLRLLSDKLSTVEPTFSEADRQSISDLVDAVLKAVVADNSLPESLRTHIATIAVEVQRCLLDYQIQGDFKLASAVERLMANVHLAEGVSNDPNVWVKLRSDWFAPIISGLIVSAPQIVLAIASLTAVGPSA